jgi:hypothetical protein
MTRMFFLTEKSMHPGLPHVSPLLPFFLRCHFSTDGNIFHNPEEHPFGIELIIIQFFFVQFLQKVLAKSPTFLFLINILEAFSKKCSNNLVLDKISHKEVSGNSLLVSLKSAKKAFF